MFSAKHCAQRTGKIGEEKACEFLKSKGYQIIKRNYQKPWGEIDIIAFTPDKTLVFFEVKTIRSRYAGSREARQFYDNWADSLKPEDNLSQAKLKKIRRSAQMFSAKHSDLICEEKGWRIDLLALTFRQNLGSILNESNGLTTNKEDCIINHYQNI
ncbi:MAG: YraN family protein [Candidatus Liptonbacteria bacterium]|nr:YraN family protein [Candidatus Liptonbacteria bacterium]